MEVFYNPLVFGSTVFGSLSVGFALGIMISVLIILGGKKEKQTEIDNQFI